MINRVTFKNKQEWLKQRTEDITSTDIAVLFDMSPYSTKFQLWHAKKSKEVTEVKTTERMDWGTALESFIAKEIAKIKGWKVRKINRYFRIASKKIGCSFDYMISDKENGNGLLEIKAVDSWVFKNNWLEDENGALEAPPHIELQLQHQMFVAGYDYGYIAVLVGGNTLKILSRKKDEKIQKLIEERSAKFWLSIEQDEPPTFTIDDADYIKSKLKRHSEKGKEITACSRIEENIKIYADAKEKEEDQVKIRKLAMAEILQLAEDASAIHCMNCTINTSTTKDNEGKEITQDMVGTVTGKRKGYRQFKVKIKVDKQ